MPEDNKIWHLSIPKILHVYWGGKKMTYLRFLTLKTFIKLNPEWKVVFWYPAKSFTGDSWHPEKGYEKWNPELCRDWLPAVKELPVIMTDIDFDALGFKSNMAEVHKADYTRVSVLDLYGGVWADSDIIFFRPITELSVNKPENRGKQSFVCISDYGHSTGFNMSSRGSVFFNALARYLQHEYNPRNYQCWGPDMFNKYFKKLESIPASADIGMDAVYAHNCHQVSELFGNAPRFTEYSIGCHWYGGNSIWGKFLNETKGGEVNLPDNIIGNLIRDAE